MAETSYTAHSWNVSEPITRGKMNHIEQGIYNADQRSSTNSSAILGINTKLGDVSSNNPVSSQLIDLNRKVKSLTDLNIGEAITELAESHNSRRTTSVGAVTTQTYENLFAHLAALDLVGNYIDEAIRSTDISLADRLNKMSQTIDDTSNTAKFAATNVTFINAALSSAMAPYDTLKDRLDTMATTAHLGELGTHSNVVSYVEDRLGLGIGNTYTAKSYTDDVVSTKIGTIPVGGINVISYVNQQRDSAINSSKDYTDGQISSVTSQIGNIGEIAAAHRVNVNNDTLDNRFDDIEIAISHEASGADAGGLTQRLSGLEDAVNHTVTGLAATKDALDELTQTVNNLNVGAATIIIPENRITYNQETGLPTIYTDSTKTTVDNTISTDYDYLLQKNDKYYYWKYINNAWKLISGGVSEGTSGNSGTSSAIIDDELPTIANANENIDYYIGTNAIGYTHYRYIPSETEGENGTFVTILPKSLTDNLNNLINHATVHTVTKTTNYQADVDDWPSAENVSGGPAIYNIADTNHTANLLDDFVAVRNARVNAVYEGEELKSQTLQVLDTKGHVIEYPIVGGSGGNAYSIRFLSTLSNNIFTVPQDSSYVTTVKAKAIVKQGNSLLDGVSFTGEVLYRLSTESNNVWHKSTINLPAITNDSEFSVNVSSILASNVTTIVRISLTINTGDGDPVSRYVDYEITKTQISISSTFNPATILTSANLVIPYTCQGTGLSKTVHFKIDGQDAITPIITSSHNVEQYATIPLKTQSQTLSNGAHTLQIYFTTNGDVTSNKLNYYIIYNLDENRKEPIIGLNVANESIIYGDELVLNYTVYTPGKETTEKVEIKLYTKDNNDEQVIYQDNIDTLTNVPIAASTWKTVKYPMPITPDEGQPEVPVHAYIEVKAYHTVTTTVDNNGETETVETVYTTTNTTEVVINRFDNPNDYDFTEVAPQNILYLYNAYGKTNNDSDRANYEYKYTANDQNGTELTFHGTFTGFNWATNGYVDGESLTISGGAEYTIDVPIFSSQYNGVTIESQSAQDITQYGRTIEIDYEVRSATNLNATIIECMDSLSSAGFRITPNCCYLTNKTTPADIEEDTGFILNESSIAAAYLQTNTRIHLVFVIEPWSNSKAYDTKYHQSVNIYVNGEFANSCPYERDSSGRIIDDFTTTATMHLGSDSCILKIYSIKIYNRGLNHSQVLQEYKLAPNVLYDRLTRFADNDVLTNGVVDYEKAKRRFNCLLLKGPDPTAQETLNHPTISPYKGSPSPAKRKKKATDTEYEGKTESGLVFTKPSSDPTKDGFVEEFRLCDKVPADAPAYLGTVGAYCSSNNVQGTTSQKYPLHNLKIYLAAWQDEAEAVYEEDPNTHEQILVSEAKSAGIVKVPYSLKGYDNNGNALGIEESTFCWKADYMSTDHANTYNANIADSLFTDKLLSNWDSKKYQNTVYGIRCLLFQQQGDNGEIVFVGDGCLNNDKGNTKTYGLKAIGDDGNDTLHQKWEFTNNTSPLDVFKSDNLMGINEKDSNNKIYAKGAFECSYPDEGDLKDDGLEPNYNHLQLLLTWVNKRACYLDYSVYDEDAQETTNYTVSDAADSGGIYNGVEYNTERELKKAIFKNEFEDHFNLNHVLTYYLFSEYVALCDNRAKNMFLRSEDIRSEVVYNASGQKILDGNSYPDDGTLWNAYVNPSTGVTTPSVINWSTTGENHSTFAKWAPVLYDLDSCFGVENVGLMTIRYNADWQYEYNNKKAFSGFDSIFWLMVEDTYADELRTLATKLYNNELNFTNFYRQQITDNKNATCQAITNQDMVLKYEQPWNDGFVNYSKTPDPETGQYPKETPEYKYIQRGTRATQKTTFMRQRSMLLSSKYVSYEFTNSMISFRAGIQVTGQDTLLTLVANQDLYPAIMFSDSNILIRPTKKIINNVEVNITDDGLIPATIPCKITTSQIGNSDTVKIVGASVLNDIGDLSKYQPYELKVGSGVNLKRLIIGSDAAGYVNSSTESIEGLSDCALLEEIDVRNITKMSSLNLGGNGLIKKVYAKGSNITTISLPNGGVLQEIEYGAKTTNITLLNQKFFTTFSYENLNPSEANTYGELKKLWIENTPNVPIVDMVIAKLSDLTGGLRLVGIELPIDNTLTSEEKNALNDKYTTFLTMLASDELVNGKHLNANGSLDENPNKPPYISGTVTVQHLRESIYNKLAAMYPDLIINAGVKDTEYKLEYRNIDASGRETLLITLYRVAGEEIPDPVVDEDPVTHKYYIQSAPADQIVFDNIQYVPIRAADAQYQYRFGKYYTSGQNIGKYQKYSGWAIKENSYSTPTSSTSIAKNLTLIAQYPDESRTLQSYTITWYDDDNSPLMTRENITYGTDASQITPPGKYNVNNPLTVKKYVNGKYKVFRGWDRPVGIVTGNIDVHSLWYESNSDFSNLTNINDLSPADLYALTQLDTGTRDSLLNSHIGNDLKYIRLGKDFDYDSQYVTTYNLIPESEDHILFSGDKNEAIIFDGTNNDSIYPLINLSQDFTLALDFKFLMDNVLWN